MKRKTLLFTFAIITITCCFSLLSYSSAGAAETASGTQTGTETGSDPSAASLSYIQMKQYPSKTIYYKGENIDLSDMVVEGVYSDGTSKVITDYSVSGFDSNLLGIQSIIINYQGQTAVFSVTVLPAKITNVAESGCSTTSFTLTWDAVSGVSNYEIYVYDDLTGDYVFTTTSVNNNVTLYFPSGTIHKVKICSAGYENGIEFKSEMSDPFTAATAPEVVTGLTSVENHSTSISLSWNRVDGATGYIIYRSPSSKNDYSFQAVSDTSNYTDKGLSSGTAYKYKVSAYTYDKAFYGAASSVIDTTTAPAKTVLKCKSGDQKVRLTYSKVKGATYYDIYTGNDTLGYTLLSTRKASNKSSCIYQDLIMGNTYSYYIVARRVYKGATYDSPLSDIVTVEIKKPEATSTQAKFYTTKSDFVKSWTYQNLKFFKKHVSYSKSIIIPGLITTNVGGFSSANMCPQGITFAGNYLLQTAYDLAGEENSVIYVINKSTKILITTLILPSKTHAGGISFDGVNVWVPYGKKLYSFQFSEVENAVASGNPYTNVTFNTTCTMPDTVSYLTYFYDKIWIGTYNECEGKNMYSYTIADKDTKPVLTQADIVAMPNRVQSVAFTNTGDLIISRSCQVSEGYRGYLHQIDVYTPNYTKTVNGVIQLGDLVNSVEMPSMNEGIAINGSYLYVTFESAAFKESIYKMDRICAFKLTSIIV